ncbi:MAG: hypothetical protein C0483_15180 [Pirellula sp.]|nr:hypothetical protein [Pirellula sp.]
MGLNDRDYARDPDSGYQLSAPQSMVGRLILLNIALWILDVMFDGKLSARFDLNADVLYAPWKLWQLVTYGFLHSPGDIFHILGNMLMLFVFGRELEQMFGKAEFLRFYLASIVLGGVAFVLFRNFVLHEPNAEVVGASAAVMAVVVLYALHFPHRTVMIWGVLPVPVWVIGAVYVVPNFFGIAGARPGDPVAYDAHMAGILFALGYYRFHWNLGAILPSADNFRKLPRSLTPRPKLKLHAPGEEAPTTSMEAEVDRILAKIHATGYDSLSPDERRMLERASARARAHKRSD